MLQSEVIGYVAAQAGICFVEECDNGTQITDLKNVWCISVKSCRYHNSQCFKTHSRGTCLYDRPVADYQPDTQLHLQVEFLLDSDRNTLCINDVKTHRLLYAVSDVDTPRDLMLVFEVYDDTDFEVMLKLVSSTSCASFRVDVAVTGV